MNLKETYNKIAEDWYKDHHADDWWVDGTDKFVSFLKPGSTVLDAGCGAGVKAKYLSNKGLNVLGIDFSEKLVEIARRENPTVEFKVMDMKDAKNLKDRFDGVFMQASLLHIPKREAPQILAGLASRLKRPGYFYVAVKGIIPGQAEESILKEDDYGYPYERFFSYYSMDELEGYFRDLELKVVYENQKRVGHTDWLQIIGKNAELSLSRRVPGYESGGPA